MSIQKIQECCEIALAAIDGAYGWLTEAVLLLGVVAIFNFFAKWVLKRLHLYFQKQKQIWHDSFVSAFYKPFSYYVWFFAIIHMIDLVAYRAVEAGAVEDLHTVLGIGAIVCFGWFLMRWKKNIVQYMITKSKMRQIALDISKIDVIDKVLTLVILFTVVLLTLEVTDRSMKALIAFSGIGGLALAFASQEIIANFFAGLMIYATKPFAKGDWIIVPEKNIEGVVEEIGWYMIHIKSTDKRPLYVPNSVFSKAVIVNPARMSHRQLKVTIGLRYEDMPQLKGIIADIKSMLQHHPDIDRTQSLLVHFAAFGSYSLDVMISAYTTVTETERFVAIKDDVLFKIDDIVKLHGAEMAFPTSLVLAPSDAVPHQENKPLQDSKHG